MLKTVIVLPDGTEIVSGAGTANAIQSVTVTECVNSGNELTLGSACSNMLEANLITPEGGLVLSAGDEVAAYKVDDAGSRHPIGLFTLEKPTRPSAHRMRITAYDRISWLDKDLTSWLAGLKQWPYRLHTFAQMVCTACGLELVNSEIPNGDYLVQQFFADGITGRQLMQWIGQIAGKFCRATAAGKVEFAWYTPAQICMGPINVEIACEGGTVSISDITAKTVLDDSALTMDSRYLKLTDDGRGNASLSVNGAARQQFFFQNGLAFEDYAVAPVEKVQLRQNEEDVGTVYPDIAEAVNTYAISGNYLLTASTAEDLKPIAQTLYELMSVVTYTPCKVSIPADPVIHAGDIVQIIDRNGKAITVYVMTKTQSGQKDVLECTGSARRDSSSAVNNQSYQTLAGKVLNLRTDVEGIKAENKDFAGHVVRLELDVAGIRTQVSHQEIATQTVQEKLTSLEQTADSIHVSVKNIQQNGTSKVVTESGYSFTDSGLIISKAGEQMENLLDHTGMYVRRAGETMLQANKDGVVATDVKVNNYLCIGRNARLEDYTDGTDSKRTACFWIGG